MHEPWLTIVQGSVAGVVVTALWPLVQKYMNTTLKQMEMRVISAETRLAETEKRLDQCEEDRQDLHRQIAEILMKIAKYTK